MIRVRCLDEDCIEDAEFKDSREAQAAGWWVNPAPGNDPSDGCPIHAQAVAEDFGAACDYGEE